MFRIQTMNKISPVGLEVFPKDKYEVGSEVADPHAILVRSADLNNTAIASSVLAIARAGAGYNNIPVSKCSESGVVVFNTPGANANAVKELALAAMLLASRDITGGINWARSIADKGAQVPDLVEKEKAKFEGPELRGKTLGVIGLGAIGFLLAGAATDLGMKAIGFDPALAEDDERDVFSKVQKAESLEALLGASDYISIHVPLLDTTKGLINGDLLRHVKNGARILNLSRAALVKDKDIVAALEAGKISAYVTDFPNAELLACKKVIPIPHLGGSTPEAEENCAYMAAKQLVDYLETGSIVNSVNFKTVRLATQRSPYRMLVFSRGSTNMYLTAQITGKLEEAKIGMLNIGSHERDDYGVSVLDIENPLPQAVADEIKALEGVLLVRILEKDR